MNLNEYQKAAQRTAQPNTDPTLRLAIAGMGLAGEAAEVLELIHSLRPYHPPQDKLIKENGDVLWYCAEIATLAGIDLDAVKLPPKDPENTHQLDRATQLAIHAGLLVDYLKKVVGHGHPIDVARVQVSLISILRAVADLTTAAGTDLDTVLTRNIEKLVARYPKGFASEGSINRQE